MRINSTIGIQKNLLNVHRFNQNLNENSTALKNTQENVRKDKVSFSSAGKAVSLIDSLMEQKQKITENKTKFIDNALKEGRNMRDLKPQIELYDEQVKLIDEQISKAMKDDIRQQAETQQKKESQPKTKEEIEAQRLNSIVSLSSDMKQSKVVSNSKDALDKEANILKSQIKTDGARGASTEAKEERLLKIQSRSLDLTAKIGERLTVIQEEIEKNKEEEKIAKPEDKTSITDSLDKDKDRSEIFAAKTLDKTMEDQETF